MTDSCQPYQDPHIITGPPQLLPGGPLILPRENRGEAGRVIPRGSADTTSQDRSNSITVSLCIKVYKVSMYYWDI